MCPYENQHSGESSMIREEVWNELEDWEKIELEKNKI